MPTYSNSLAEHDSHKVEAMTCEQEREIRKCKLFASVFSCTASSYIRDHVLLGPHFKMICLRQRYRLKATMPTWMMKSCSIRMVLRFWHDLTSQQAPSLFCSSPQHSLFLFVLYLTHSHLCFILNTSILFLFTLSYVFVLAEKRENTFRCLHS